MTRVILTILTALSLSGCAQFVNGINSVSGALSSPQTTVAVHNLQVGAAALICDVGSVAAITSAISKQIGAGNALIKDSANVYVISASICATLGGTVTAPIIIPASATTTLP